MDPHRVAQLFLVVGLVALTLALLLYGLIRHIRKRYDEGRAALDDLRQQAQGMNLEMQGTVGSVPEPPNPPESLN